MTPVPPRADNERPDIEAIRRSLLDYERYCDLYDYVDLGGYIKSDDIRALLGEVERLNRIITDVKTELNSELQRAEDMTNAPSCFYIPKAYVDGRARTAMELIGFLNGLMKNDQS